MNKLKTIFLLLAFILAMNMSGVQNIKAENYPYKSDYLWLTVPDHADWLYQTGENAKVEVSFCKYGIPRDGELKYSIGNDMLQPDKHGSVKLKNGRAVINMGTKKTPGFRDMKLSVSLDGKTYEHHIKVGFSVDKIKPYTQEPQDFRSFWQKNVEELKQVPMSYTGGFGVDFSYMAARLGAKSMYVERQKHLCEAAKENFERLGLKHVVVKNGDGVEALHAIPNHSGLRVIYIDPARRDDAGNKVVSLQDCTPDVTRLQEEMLQKADFVVIKLSPMLDWHRAVSELRCVREVHVVSVNNECKELLLVLSARNMDENSRLRIYCVNDTQSFVCDDAEMASSVTRITAADLDSAQYLYEPNASLMKAGCFGVLSERYSVSMLSKNSHLFVSRFSLADFPGRSFRIRAVSSFNKKELKRHLQGIVKANIATRNFPLSVAELRKRLKLKDGGETYIFATTLSDDSHVLLITDKILENA